jgi:glycosyltransferase
MCGFKFLKRDILEVLIENGADNNGWFFSTELLVVADYKKFKILDLPIRWTDDPSSKVKIIKLSIEYLKAIFNLKKRLKQNEV